MSAIGVRKCNDRMNWIQFLLIIVAFVVVSGLLIALADYLTYRDIVRTIQEALRIR